MSLRDEGIYSTGNVLLYVAEAVLKHTMSHDHSHYSSFPFFLFYFATETETPFEAVDLFVLVLACPNVEEIPFSIC